MSVFHLPWFYWAVGIAIGLPIAMILLTELHDALLRRNSHLARQVNLLRNYLLPLGALLLLLVGASQIPASDIPVRVLTTVFGLLVLVLLLSGLNATMFQSAPEKSWRKRLPAIFLDVAWTDAADRRHTDSLVVRVQPTTHVVFMAPDVMFQTTMLAALTEVGAVAVPQVLAIETDAGHVVKRLVHVSHHDWKHSRKLDLSDEAVKADLEKHGVRE